MKASREVSPRAFWLCFVLVLCALMGWALVSGYRFGELVFLALIFSPGLGIVFALCYGFALLVRKLFPQREDV